MSEKAQVLAYDREKRVYKDAYVDNFRKVRYFPSLATIGAGKADGESIILVQESPREPPPLSSTSDPTTQSATTRRLRSNLEDVPSRLMPLDSLEAMFESTSPLSLFRSAVMCKHTKGRLDMGLSPLSTTTPASQSNNDTDAPSNRFGRIPTTSAFFKPPSAADAKGTIERKITYDPHEYVDKSGASRSFAPRDGMPQWSYTNPVHAKEEIRTKRYVNVPPEGVVTADRKYTQEFIRQHVEASQTSRSQRRRE